MNINNINLYVLALANGHDEKLKQYRGDIIRYHMTDKFYKKTISKYIHIILFTASNLGNFMVDINFSDIAPNFTFMKLNLEEQKFIMEWLSHMIKKYNPTLTVVFNKSYNENSHNTISVLWK